jgi:hypothetical protein
MIVIWRFGSSQAPTFVDGYPIVAKPLGLASSIGMPAAVRIPRAVGICECCMHATKARKSVELSGCAFSIMQSDLSDTGFNA